jgi:hypothetical protein
MEILKNFLDQTKGMYKNWFTIIFNGKGLSHFSPEIKANMPAFTTCIQKSLCYGGSILWHKS